MPFNVYPIKSRKGRQLVRRAMRSKGSKALYRNGSRYNANMSVGLSKSLVGPDPFPSSKFVIHTYGETPVTLLTGVNIYGAEQRFRLNSVFDPNYSFGGHSPSRYANLANLYGRYRVEWVEWEVVFTTPGAEMDIGCGASVACDTSGSLGGASWFGPIEMQGGSFAMLSPSGERRAILKGRVYLNQLFGISREMLKADDQYSAVYNGSPIQEPLLSIAVCASNGAANVAVQAMATIRYGTTWYKRFMTV